MVDQPGFKHAQKPADANGKQAPRRRTLMERLHAEFPITDEEVAALHQRTLERLIARREEILKDALTANELAAKFHLSRQTFLDRYKAGKMLGVQDGNRLLFPKWQLDPEQPYLVVNGLAPVLSALAHNGLTDLAKASWFLLPNMQLGGVSPKDMLWQGGADEVRRTANTAGGDL